MKYLGIDYGSKKVGLALSDAAGTMGFPKGIIANTPHLVEDIRALIAKEGVEAIVIGESKDFFGGDNQIAEQARAFGELLAKEVPVFYEPETLTTAEARRQYEQSEKTRKHIERPDVDDSAAALILTSYLSRPHG